jgi:twitching motility protein PilT
MDSTGGMMALDAFLKTIYEKGASDLHIKVGRPPMMRLRGDLVPFESVPALTPQDIQQYLYSVLSSEQQKRLEEDRELDFSFFVRGMARFRGNAFFQKGSLGAVFRIVPAKIPTLEELGMPEILKQIVNKKQGLILVTGPTGAGKSTTLAAMIDYINSTMPVHIITIEDPIEFVYHDKLAVVNQREVGADTGSFPEALRRAFRQDPDVILIGEMRDEVTIATALTAAETGHLVLGTLHTNDAKQTIDRILDTFPPQSQTQVRMQLAKCLNAIIAQRLLKRRDGQGRLAVQEILINTPMVQKLIEDNKVGAVSKAIEESATFYKMQSFNQALLAHIRAKAIDVSEALAFSNNPNDLKIQLQSQGFSDPALSPEPPGLAAREGGASHGF